MKKESWLDHRAKEFSKSGKASNVAADNFKAGALAVLEEATKRKIIPESAKDYDYIDFEDLEDMFKGES